MLQRPLSLISLYLYNMPTWIMHYIIILDVKVGLFILGKTLGFKKLIELTKILLLKQWNSYYVVFISTMNEEEYYAYDNYN